MRVLESLTLCVSLSGTITLADAEVAVVPPALAQVIVPTQPVTLPAAASPQVFPPPIPKRPLPFPTLNSEQFDRQIQRYLRYVADQGAPDILIIGSSRALWGVDPIALQTALQQRGYPNLKIYNFGINGATAQVMDLLVRRVLSSDQLPHLIVWADGSRAFNSGRIDQTYNNIVASPGYQLLAAGKRPTPLPASTATQLCLDLSAHPFTQLPAQPPAPLQLGHAGRTLWGSVLCDRPFKISLQPDSSAKATHKSWDDLQADLGFQPLTAKFNPATYFQRYPKVSGQFDADYRNFTLAGNQTTALKNVLSYARSRRIPIVFVNLPLTRIYLEAERMDYEQAFSAFMQQFANYGTLTFYDLGQRWPTQHDYFIDPSHLNRYGAAAVSEAIAQRLAVNRGLTRQFACASEPQRPPQEIQVW